MEEPAKRADYKYHVISKKYAKGESQKGRVYGHGFLYGHSLHWSSPLYSDRMNIHLILANIVSVPCVRYTSVLIHAFKRSILRFAALLYSPVPKKDKLKYLIVKDRTKMETRGQMTRLQISYSFNKIRTSGECKREGIFPSWISPIGIQFEERTQTTRTFNQLRCNDRWISPNQEVETCSKRGFVKIAIVLLIRGGCCIANILLNICM